MSLAAESPVVPGADALFESEPDPMSNYVAGVRARVDAKKRYPALARRRSEEGLVIAQLSIGLAGKLDELELGGSGPMLLRRATRAAIEAAAPFAVPPRGPVVIEIPVRWRVYE